MSKSQVEIVQNAQRLAADLQAGPSVTKNALLSVVATFMSDPAGDLERLGRTLKLLENGSGGHLKRGGGFGEQVHLVIREVNLLLARNEWQPKELKSLFGWTARLLQVRQGNRSPGREESRTTRNDRQGPRQGRSRNQEKRPPSPPVKKTFQGVSGKNLDVLKAFGKKLSDPEGEKS